MIQIAVCDDKEKAVSRHEEIIKTSLQSCWIGKERSEFVWLLF